MIDEYMIGIQKFRFIYCVYKNGGSQPSKTLVLWHPMPSFDLHRHKAYMLAKHYTYKINLTTAKMGRRVKEKDNSGPIKIYI